MLPSDSGTSQNCLVLSGQVQKNLHWGLYVWHHRKATFDALVCLTTLLRFQLVWPWLTPVDRNLSPWCSKVRPPWMLIVPNNPPKSALLLDLFFLFWKIIGFHSWCLNAVWCFGRRRLLPFYLQLSQWIILFSHSELCHISLQLRISSQLS